MNFSSSKFAPLNWFAAAEFEGDDQALPVPTRVQAFDVHSPLPEINFDDGECFGLALWL